MRPARPRNEPWRPNDDRRRGAPPPDDRDQHRDAHVDGYGSIDEEPVRDDVPRGRRSATGEARWSAGDQPPSRRPPHPSTPYDPYNPYDTGRERFDADANDPDRGRDQGPRDRNPRERVRTDREPDRQTERANDRPAAYSPTRRTQTPRYGAISPSDDLSWPDTEPAEAEWQPARTSRRTSGTRSVPPASRQPETRRDDLAEPAMDDRSTRRVRQPGWSGGATEPDDQWSDDLAYDVLADDPAGPRPGHDRSGGWRDATRTGTGSVGEPAEVAGGRPPRDDDPADAWMGSEDTDDAVDEPLPADDPRAALFGSPERPPRRSSRPRDGIRPPLWGMSGYAWRFARKLTIPRTNRLLRLGASRVLPASTRARFAAMQLPQTEVDETLAQVRSLDDWAEAWTGTAQRFLGETRRGGDMTPTEAARSRQLAALCYHVASFFAFGDDRLARTSRSASTTLFAQSLGLLLPETRQVDVRWRSKTMPGYLTIPSWATGRRPLAVLLNGATTSREELILWSEEFLAQGLAVLALDTPGFGQGGVLGPVSLDSDDIMDGIVELAEADPGLDPAKVSLVGISLGGTMALRAAAGDRRVSAVVAVTPLHEPARWLGASSQVSLAQIVPLFGGYDQLADFVLGLDMATTLAATEAQVLVFGAGRDLVVPPPEASRLAAALGEQATLVWFDDAGHALFDVLPEWTREAAEWLAVVMDVADAPIFTEQERSEERDPSFQPDDRGSETGDLANETTSTEGARWNDAEGDPATPPGINKPPARSPDWRQPLNPRSPVRSADPATTGAPVMARPPEPAPYGAVVFDAEQAEQRRSGQQRGYETGAFGPLGPAAARILADEPTPEPGSADWGYEDGNPWTEHDQTPAWSDPLARATPSTARLWADGDQTHRPEPVPRRTSVDPVQHGERPDGPAGQTDEPLASSNGLPSPDGDELQPRSPAVGRGRSSEPFATVPLAEPVLAAPPDPNTTTGLDETGTATANADEPIRGLATPEDDPPRPRMATPGDAPSEQDGPDTHAPFRPPPERND